MAELLKDNIWPPSGTYGTEITITGFDFGTRRGKVLLGNVALKILEWTDSLIRCQLTRALSPETYGVTIQTKGVSPIAFDNAFTVKTPEIDSVDPTSGSVGDESIIEGKFFGTKKAKVSLGKKSCKIVNWEMNPTTGESAIRFVVPKGINPGTCELKVTTSGKGSDTVNFTVE